MALESGAIGKGRDNLFHPLDFQYRFDGELDIGLFGHHRLPEHVADLFRF
jgi:hypothetical protein